MDLQNGFPLQAKWHSEYFRNENPLILEIGCGKGEYTVNLAKKYPEKNFIGIDRKGARLWRGAKTAFTDKMQNVAFIRTQADHLNKIFSLDEVSEIWLTFPDPQLGKKSKFKKRLTSPRFLERYSKFLREKGYIHLKTDDDTLYNYTLDIIHEFQHEIHFNSSDLYDGNTLHEASEIQTFYEKMHLAKGLKIKYIRFSICK